MVAPTLFSFGYWGWGSAVAQCVEAADAVEKARGFAPPLFVDIRISRSVRAKGFAGNAFAALAGESRYRWLDSLGNVGVLDRGAMRIKDPAAADDLLDLALGCIKGRRRLLFFCACERPCHCHRATVAALVLEAGARRKVPVEVVEWPGGEPRLDLSFVLTRAEFDKVLRGAASLPLGSRMSLAESAAVPWYSLVSIRPDDDDVVPTWRLVTGPAKYKKTGWSLPVYGVIDNESETAMLAEVNRARAVDGFAIRTVPVNP
jgi:hypothetical protein